MIERHAFPAVLLAILLAAAAPRTYAASQSPGGSPSAPLQIFIDQNCRILPDNTASQGQKKTHPYRDSAICHLESVHSSEHWEEWVRGHQLFRSLVRIREREFVLSDISEYPVMYVVQQIVPENWAIDSDPQPVKIVGSTAYFNVYVQPRQTVRLHLGMRRDWPLKPKLI